MSDYTLDPNVVLIFGAQKSGKTGYAFSYMLNAGAACNFIFDDTGQAQRRLRVRACNTERECEEALATRWVVFNPHVMFKANPTLQISGRQALRNALMWFASWSLGASKRGPGRKIFFADEAWQHMDGRGAPEEIEDIVRQGRWEDLEILLATHRPSEFPRNIRALLTEIVAFNTQDDYDLDAVKPYMPKTAVAVLPTLQRGEFIAHSRPDNSTVRARFF